MMLPVVRCSHCGKAVKISEATFVSGKAFCSEECRKQNLSKTI